MTHWKFFLGLLLITLIGTFLWKVNITWIIAAPDAERYGEELAHTGKPVKRCLTVTTLFPSYPPSGQLRSLCIRGYAKAAKDPSACELLMPGEYGTRCIAEVWSAALVDPLCQSDEKKLYCYEKKDENGNVIGSITEQPKPPLDHCETLKPKAAMEWCIARRVFEGKSDSCSVLEPKTQAHDECIHLLAFRTHNLLLCDTIHHQIVQSVCKVRIKMAEKYPHLRSQQ